MILPPPKTTLTDTRFPYTTLFRSVAAHDHRVAVGVQHHVAVGDADLGIRAGLDGGLLGTALGRAADVEGAHGELGARLADRLRGDDADRLADVHLGAAGAVAPVAGAADAAYRLAHQRRADEDGVDAGTRSEEHTSELQS